MTVNREEFAEGGLMSDQRLYLRFLRERLSILACAAPFGKIYFFSCRVIHVPALVRLWHIIAALMFLNVTGFLLIKPLGLTFAFVAEIALLFALVGVMRNAGRVAFDDLDRLLLRIPVVSTIYQDWFRVDTFYREDTRSLYISMLPQLIREAAEEICAQKGFKLVRQRPIAPDLEGIVSTVAAAKGRTEITGAGYAIGARTFFRTVSKMGSARARLAGVSAAGVSRTAVRSFPAPSDDRNPGDRQRAEADLLEFARPQACPSDPAASAS